jgi:hypothetical protein
MDLSDTLAVTIVGVIITGICAIILSVLCLFLGYHIWSVFFMYIILAIIPSIFVNMDVDTSSTITASLLTIIIVFLIMNYVFTMIFGPNIGFPYSMLKLGPIITGLIVSLVIGIIAALYRK